jgi:hypothetical protein
MFTGWGWGSGRIMDIGLVKSMVWLRRGIWVSEVLLILGSEILPLGVLVAFLGLRVKRVRVKRVTGRPDGLMRFVLVLTQLIIFLLFL